MKTNKIKVIDYFKYRKADLRPKLDLGKEINGGYIGEFGTADHRVPWQNDHPLYILSFS